MGQARWANIGITLKSPAQPSSHRAHAQLDLIIILDGLDLFNLLIYFPLSL
jgi:hypothetical protein